MYCFWRSIRPDEKAGRRRCARAVKESVKGEKGVKGRKLERVGLDRKKLPDGKAPGSSPRH